MKKLFMGCLAILMVVRLTQGFPLGQDPTRAHLIDLLQNALFKVQQRTHMADHTDSIPVLGDASGGSDIDDGSAGDHDIGVDNSGGSSVAGGSSGGDNIGGNNAGLGNISGDSGNSNVAVGSSSDSVSADGIPGNGNISGGSFGVNSIDSSDSGNSNVAVGSSSDSFNADGIPGNSNINGGNSGASVIGGNDSGVNRLGEDTSVDNNGVNRGPDENNRSEEWFKEDFKLKNLFKMPSNDFLLETIMQRIEMPIPAVDAIKEFALDPSSLTPFDNVLSDLEPLLTKPSSFATALTMELLPGILKWRMFCPSTVLNQFLMRLWEFQYQSFVSSDSDIYGQFKEAAMAVFPALESTELDRFATDAIEMVHSQLLNDSYTMVISQELGDVASATKRIYKSLFARKASVTGSAETFPSVTEIVEDSLRIADVRCRTGKEIAMHNEVALSLFMKDWQDLEVNDVCEVIEEFSYSYFARRIDQIPGVDAEWLQENVSWEKLQDLCDWAKDFIERGIFTPMLQYQSTLTERATDKLLAYFDFLEPNERVVLVEVLARLGWPAPGTIGIEGSNPASTNNALASSETPSANNLAPFPARYSDEFQDSLEESPADEPAEKDTQSDNRSILRNLLTRLAIAAFPDKLMPPITDAEVHERSPVDIQESRETEWSKPSQETAVNEDRKGFSYNPIYPFA